MPDSPPNLAALRKMLPGRDRVRAANAYIAEREQAIRDARELRDHDIRAMAKTLGPAETARQIGMSEATVKVVRRGHS